MQWLKDRPGITAAILFVFGAIVLSAVSGGRISQQSPDPHFVLQADSWLSGSLAIPPPWKGDDPAIVETVRLKDGRQIRGRYLHAKGWSLSDPWFLNGITNPRKHFSTQPRLPLHRLFRTTAGNDLPAALIQSSTARTHYVSFPPMPALLMLPQVALFGRTANDVLFTIFFAALILPLSFLTLRRLRDSGLSARSDRDHLWLIGQLSFGTVLFFVSVSGRVWFTAHVIGVVFALGYCYFSIEARRPILAGLLLGCATLSRTPMAFMFPFFAFEACRIAGGSDWRQWHKYWKDIGTLWLRFALPVLAIAVLAGFHNHMRFGSVLEFGHSYLAVRQQALIEAHGLFDYEYFRRNLSVAFTLLPNFNAQAPYIHLSGHGMALWLTTPLFLTLLWPKCRNLAHTSLWCTAGLIAIPILCYQNSGWFQFGYRFSLDFSVFLILLLTVGGRPLTRIAKTLIIVSIVINLFGAMTFGRHHQFYDGGTYDTVVAH